MASPQKENGYTAIANETLEALVKLNLNGTHFALIFAIMRKTYGFQKKEDAISIDQFVNMLKVSRRTVIYTLQDLEAKGIVLIRRSRDGEKNNVNIIRFNKNYETWLVNISADQVEKNRSSAKLRKQGGSAKLGSLVVQNSVENLPSFAPTKETIQKKTKEIGKTSVLQGFQWQELIDAFKEVNPSYLDFFRNKTERSALESMAKQWGYEKLLSTIQALPQIIGQPYAPKITRPSDLKRDIGKLIAFTKQQSSLKTKRRVII